VAGNDLDAPSSDLELFETEEEALQLRPFMTGDVFAGVTVGDDTDLTVAIGGHPCVIRGNKGKLQSKVPCLLVRPSDNPIAYDEWPHRQFEKFPLLAGLSAGSNLAVRLDQWLMVPQSQLKRERRILTLQDRGVYFFLQRFTHSTTRCAFPLHGYEEGFSRVLDEAQLEFQWVGDFAEANGDTRDEAVIKTIVEEFHDFLDEDNGRRRELLKKPGGQSSVLSEMNLRVSKRTGLT
jgi:hypothetical protein